MKEWDDEDLATKSKDELIEIIHELYEVCEVALNNNVKYLDVIDGFNMEMPDEQD